MTEERAKQILSEANIEESATPDHVVWPPSVVIAAAALAALRSRYKVTVPADARVEMTGEQRGAQG